MPEYFLGDRFLVVRSINASAEGESFLCRDQHLRMDVVVKAIPEEAVSKIMFKRLENRVAALRHLHTPYFAPIIQVGQDNTTIFLVRPYVEGLSLSERLRLRLLSVDETLAVGRSVLSALQDIHALGLLHRNINPDHVLLAKQEPVTQATLLDLWNAAPEKLSNWNPHQTVFDAKFTSPEQAGLLGGEIGPNSDIYSLGALLFECLTGRAPFEGQVIGEILKQHLTAPPPDLKKLNPQLPEALNSVIQRCLKKDPADRYQTAFAVLSDINAISERMSQGVQDPALVTGLQDRRQTLTTPAFIGREAELAGLRELLDSRDEHEGGVVLIESESGGGKTILMSELAKEAEQRGFWVLHGQGLTQAAQRPLQELTPLVERIAAEMNSDPNVRKRIIEQLGDYRDALCAALPALSALLECDSSKPLGPEQFGEARCLRALSLLLGALGTAERPAAVILEDSQWADEMTLKLLSEFQRFQKMTPGDNKKLLIFVAFRSEEVPAHHPIRQLKAAAHLTLKPFQREEIRRLAESMAGPLPEEALKVIEQFSRGVPFMATAVLRGLVESKALIPKPAGWEVNTSAMWDIQSSQEAASILSRRINLLPPETVSLLTVGAVIGKEFDLKTVSFLSHKPSPEILSAIEIAGRRQIIWILDDGHKCQFVHDQLREEFLKRLTAEERRLYHRQLAVLLEEKYKENSFDLAFHFDAAGDHDRALPYALAAAETARAQHALETAEQQYRICERGARENDLPTRLKVAEGLGNILMLRGRYEEAVKYFTTAKDLAATTHDRAEIMAKLGEVAFKRGDIKKSIVLNEEALEMLGIKVPHNVLVRLFITAWEFMFQVLHGWFPGAFRSRKSVEGAERTFLQIRLLSRLSYSYWFRFGIIRAFWPNLRAMNLAEAYPPTLELAQVYSEHVAGLAAVGWWSRGKKYFEKSREIRRALRDVWGEGQTLNFYAVLLYFSSQFEEAIGRGREAVRLLEKTGDYWEMDIARYQVGASLYRLGRLKEASEEAKSIHLSGLEIGDIMASGISLDILVRAAQGRVPAETLKKELQRTRDDIQPQVQVLMAEGIRLIYARRPGEAVAYLEKGLDMLKKSRFWNNFVSPVIPWLVTAHRLAMEEKVKSFPQQIKASSARLKKLLRIGRLFSLIGQNELPHLCREMALLLAIEGKFRQSRRYFHKSIKVAERQKAAYERALTLRARGEMGVEFGWPHAAEEVQMAGEMLAQMEGAVDEGALLASIDETEKPVTLSLIDRFDNVVEQGRLIASALSREAVVESLKQAALTLIRGEECRFLTIEEIHAQSASGDPLIELAKEAVVKERAVVLEGGASTAAGMDFGGARSALAGPVFSRDHAVGCFLVTHTKLAGLFGGEELRLADYIATIAGAALENAEGFAQLQDLNVALEARVEARTKEIREANAKLEQLTLTDPLTNLLNRRGLENALVHEFQNRQGSPLDLLIVLVDLDDFKHINDTLGYSSGDVAIKSTAERIRESLRSTDHAARVGGDEFLILLPDTREAEGIRIAERLCTKISKTTVTGPSGSFKVSASLGVVRSLNPMATLDQLLAQAHIALHRSKVNGKGQVTFGEWDAQAHQASRQDKINALELMRRGEGLYAAKMPLIRLSTNEVMGYEFLVRSNIKGYELPEDMFGLCRESDVLTTIDYECFKVCAKEAEKIPHHIRCFLNVFPYTLVHLPPRHFLEAFKTIPAPQRIGVEISEQQIVGDPSMLSDAAKAMKKLGFLIVMDDIGFGRSNLETFIALEPDVVKIDKRFVQGISRDPNLQRFMQRTLNIMRNSGAEIIAEGIENKEDLDTLKSMGVVYGQGFLWGKPAPCQESNQKAA